MVRHRKPLSGLLFGFTVFLSGCVADRILPYLAEPDSEITVSMAGTKIVIGNVSGYCVKKRQSKNTQTTAFVVLAPCNPEIVHNKALLIASISGEASVDSDLDPEALMAFFESERGHKLLSSANDPKTVEIQETVQDNGVLYVFSRDSAAPVIPDTVNDKWRGFFPVSGRMVAISMVNFMDSAMSAEQALKQLKIFADAIQQRNIAGVP